MQLDAVITIEGSASGLQNMQRDLSLLQQAEQDGRSSFFSLRLYRWSEPTITYGFAQKAKQLFDYERLQQDGVAIVARSTGGRALLHHDELTYALCASINHPVFGGSLLESYQKIASCLCLFLEELNMGKKISVNRERASGGMSENRGRASGCTSENPERAFENPSESTFERIGQNSLCYLSTGFMEIELDGKKLIGSAQKRGRFAYLQHGSIPIKKSPYNIAKYLVDKTTNNREPKVAVLSDYLDESLLDFDFLANRLANTFAKS